MPAPFAVVATLVVAIGLSLVAAVASISARPASPPAPLSRVLAVAPPADAVEPG